MLLALCGWKSAFVWSLVLPMHMQTQQSQPQTVDKFLDPNRLLRASYRQHLTLTSTRIHFKRSQNQHIQGSAQTPWEKDPVNIRRSISKGWSPQEPDPAETNFASCGQLQHGSLHTVVEAEPDSQPSWGWNPCISEPIVFKNQLQHESSHNLHRDIVGTPNSSDQEDCATES